VLEDIVTYVSFIVIQLAHHSFNDGWRFLRRISNNRNILLSFWALAKNLFWTPAVFVLLYFFYSCHSRVGGNLSWTPAVFGLLQLSYTRNLPKELPPEKSYFIRYLHGNRRTDVWSRMIRPGSSLHSDRCFQCNKSVSWWVTHAIFLYGG